MPRSLTAITCSSIQQPAMPRAAFVSARHSPCYHVLLCVCCPRQRVTQCLCDAVGGQHLWHCGLCLCRLAEPALLLCVCRPAMGTLQLSAAAADLDQAVEVQSGMMAWNPSGRRQGPKAHMQLQHKSPAAAAPTRMAEGLSCTGTKACEGTHTAQDKPTPSSHADMMPCALLGLCRHQAGGGRVGQQRQGVAAGVCQRHAGGARVLLGGRP